MKIKHSYTIRIVIMAITFGAVCFSACKDKRKDNITKIVKEWTGKEILFPEGLACTSMGRDTSCVDLYSDSYKILLYVDSTGCTSCRLNLSDWNRIMGESDSAFITKPKFVFVFQPKKSDEKELHYVLESNGFCHPVFVDKENEFNKTNKFPSNPDYQCFLLDKDNKVIMVGNPSQNTGIWTLYKSVINREKETTAHL